MLWFTKNSAGLLKRYILQPFETWLFQLQSKGTPPFTSCNVQVYNVRISVQSTVKLCSRIPPLFPAQKRRPSQEFGKTWLAIRIDHLLVFNGPPSRFLDMQLASGTVMITTPGTLLPISWLLYSDVCCRT